jgi:hypothetical protein
MQEAATMAAALGLPPPAEEEEGERGGGRARAVKNGERKNEELFSSAKSVKKEKVCRKVEVFLPCSRSFSASTSESVLSCYTRIVVWCPPFLGEKGQK